MLTDQIILGVTDRDLRMRLLKEPQLNMEKAVHMCLLAEETKKQMDIITRDNGRGGMEDVHQVRRDVRKNTSGNVVSCTFCGSTHARRKCLAYGKKCDKCHRMNHFSKVCRATSSVNEGLRSDDEDNGSEYVSVITEDILNIETAKGKVHWCETIRIKTIKICV